MKIEPYAQGTPCWVELRTTDQEAAKSFYSELFGWGYDENPIDESGQSFYSMAVQGGLYAGAIYTQQEGMKQKGIPPHWGIYLAVDDVDATAARVADRGGSVEGPFDVFDSGRMAVLTDPTGAIVHIWQAKRHIGAGVKNEHGSIGWCELFTSDPTTATPFYTSLLGLKHETMSMAQGMEYTVYMSEGAVVGGAMALPDHMKEMNLPSHWLVYFNVDDVDATIELALSRGAQVTMQPIDVAGAGREAHVLDPQGARFGLITPEQQ